jgi:secreted trypsin-like serine protease
MKSTRALIFSPILIIPLFLGCGGGGGGGNDSGNGLRTDTCADIGLNSKVAKIINGTVCTNLTRSAVVRVLILDSSGQPDSLCSGTMITPNTVLTAAHCFPTQPPGVAIVAGDPDAPIIVSAVSVTIHPRYQVTDAELINDVAIIKTDSAVNVPTLPLLSSSSVAAGDLASIYGFGTDNSNAELAKDLRSGEMRIASVGEFSIEADFDGNGSNTCFGDSGGPLIVNTANGPAIAGITSSGISDSCSSGDMSLFTNIQGSAVASFIRQHASGAGSR